MRILVIGGTRFLGRHLVDIALDKGHNISLFNRGKTNPDLFPDIEKFTGDRDGGLAPLEGKRWDAVIDTCGYFPRIVGQSAELLKETAGRYVFISSISVYDDHSKAGVNEESPLGKTDNPAIEEMTGESYGPLKVLCENEVIGRFYERSLIIRPGLIVGPHDPSDRFSYWVSRICGGGRVIAPQPKDLAVQFIDARDLCVWVIRLIEKNIAGTYNATGPKKIMTMQELLEKCVSRLNKNTELTWIDEKFLTDNGVEPWTDLPLWLPGEKYYGFGRVNISKALKAGLKTRKIKKTLIDTRDWLFTRPDDYEWKNGLTRRREEELIRLWDER